VMTDFSNQKPPHYICRSQQWSMIEWRIWNASFYKQALGVLNILSQGMRCGTGVDDGVSNALEILSKVGRNGEYMYWLRWLYWSSDIILGAIQLWNGLLSIIYPPWFFNWTLKLISMTDKSMLCSHISLVCPCSSFCTPWQRPWAGIGGESTVHVRYKLHTNMTMIHQPMGIRESGVGGNRSPWRTECGCGMIVVIQWMFELKEWLNTLQRCEGG
jgi:hypothetical protein